MFTFWLNRNTQRLFLNSDHPSMYGANLRISLSKGPAVAFSCKKKKTVLPTFLSNQGRKCLRYPKETHTDEITSKEDEISHSNRKMYPQTFLNETQRIVSLLFSQVNPLLPKISLVILLTFCHSILIMSVWRIWHWINE